MKDMNFISLPKEEIENIRVISIEEYKTMRMQQDRKMESMVLRLNSELKILKGQSERLYTIKEAAEQVLGCSQPTVYRLIKEGKLNPVEFFSDRRLKHSNLQAYINSLPTSNR